MRLARPRARPRGRRPAARRGHRRRTRYALYAVKMKFEDEPAQRARSAVREVVAATPEAHAAIWELPARPRPDAPARARLAARADDPLPHLVTEAHAAPVRLHDGAVGAAGRRAARAARSAPTRRRSRSCSRSTTRSARGTPAATRCAGTATTATCAPTAIARRARSSDAELGAAYLGGTTLAALARAGRVRELRPGALATASRAFRGEAGAVVPGDLLVRLTRTRKLVRALDYRSLGSRRTRPPPAPASVAGPRGAAMPSTRIAFSPRPSFSRPSVEETSSPVRSRTRSSR